MLSNSSSTGSSGLLLWAWGRCGTGTFWDSWRETLEASGMRATSLCGKKEGLQYTSLKPAHVDECLSEIPPGSTWFTHLKPKFLHRSAWETPLAAISAFKDRGAKVLVVIRRPNWLARDVSAIEDRIAHALLRGKDYRRTCEVSAITGGQCPGNCADKFALYEDMIQRGIQAGRTVGMSVVVRNYDKLDWPCPVIEAATAAAVHEGLLPRIPSPPCVVASSHDGAKSHVGESTLEGKVGKCTADAVRRELEGTAHEWMTDLSRQLPPAEHWEPAAAEFR